MDAILYCTLREKSGINDLDFSVALMKPSLDWELSTFWDTPETSLTHFSAACVWQGNAYVGTTGLLPNWMRVLISSSVNFLSKGGDYNVTLFQNIISL